MFWEKRFERIEECIDVDRKAMFVIIDKRYKSNKNRIVNAYNKLQKENELLKKQVAALIESHPNRAMYNGAMKKQ